MVNALKPVKATSYFGAEIGHEMPAAEFGIICSQGNPGFTCAVIDLILTGTSVDDLNPQTGIMLSRTMCQKCAISTILSVVTLHSNVAACALFK